MDETLIEGSGAQLDNGKLEKAQLTLHRISCSYWLGFSREHLEVSRNAEDRRIGQ